MAIRESLDRQLKVLALVFVYVEFCAKGKVPIYCTIHLKSYSFWSNSSQYWDSKKGTKIYAAHLNFVW